MGGKGPAGSSTARGPEQSLRRGPAVAKGGRGRVEGVTQRHGHWRGMGQQGRLLLWGTHPSLLPLPWVKVPQEHPRHSVSQHGLRT